MHVAPHLTSELAPESTETSRLWQIALAPEPNHVSLSLCLQGFILPTLFSPQHAGRHTRAPRVGQSRALSFMWLGSAAIETMTATATSCALAPLSHLSLSLARLLPQNGQTEASPSRVPCCAPCARRPEGTCASGLLPDRRRVYAVRRQIAAPCIATAGACDQPGRRPALALDFFVGGVSIVARPRVEPGAGQIGCVCGRFAWVGIVLRC